VTKALLALRTHALSRDGTEEGVACAGTILESRTIAGAAPKPKAKAKARARR
jgi:hypothetical protein